MEQTSQFEAKCITRCSIHQGPRQNMSVVTPTREQWNSFLLKQDAFWGPGIEREWPIFLSNFDIWVFVCFVALCLLHFCTVVFTASTWTASLEDVWPWMWRLDGPCSHPGVLSWPVSEVCGKGGTFAFSTGCPEHSPSRGAVLRGAGWATGHCVVALGDTRTPCARLRRAVSASVLHHCLWGGGGVNEGPEIRKGSCVLSGNQNARLPGNIPRGFRLNPA